jgi:signal transduction histidine kinase
LGRPVELTLRRANSSEFRAELAISRVPTEDPPRCTALIRDITERKKAEQEIRRLNEELEQRVIQRTTQLKATNKELEAFSYSVSHDLRAPLDHIAAHAEILQAEAAPNLPESNRQHLQTIADSARQLGHLIDALLAFSQMSRADLHQQRVSLTALLEEARHELRREIEGRNIV